MTQFSQLLRSKEHQNLSGTLRPSGRFSVVQLFPRKSKVLNHAEKKIGTQSAMLPVQEIDENYSRLLGGELPPLRTLPEQPSQRVSGIGLSDASISRSRAARGSKGINANQRDKLCWGAGQLEFMYGRGTMSFLTYTLPTLSVLDLESVQANWSKIVNRVVERIRRKLESRNCRSAVVGCTELQMGRYETSGSLYPHLHLVFKGRQNTHAGWAVTAAEYRSIWREIVSPFLAEFDGTWDSSENIQPVRKGVGGYLSKYISKCASKQLEAAGSTWHPSDWIILSRTIRKLYDRLTYKSYDLGLTLFRLVREWTPRLGYVSRVTISTPAYGERTIGYTGWLRGEARHASWAEFCATDNVGRKIAA